MVISNAPIGSTAGSSSAIWMVRPSSRLDRQVANPIGSTSRNSPASWPASTIELICSRQRSSDLRRTLPTSMLRAA